MRSDKIGSLFKIGDLDISDIAHVISQATLLPSFLLCLTWREREGERCNGRVCKRRLA